MEEKIPSGISSSMRREVRKEIPSGISFLTFYFIMMRNYRHVSPIIELPKRTRSPDSLTYGQQL